jgi:hypothetical protein
MLYIVDLNTDENNVYNNEFKIRQSMQIFYN